MATHDEGEKAIRAIARTPEGAALVAWLKWREQLRYPAYTRGQSVEETHYRLGRQSLALEIIRISEAQQPNE